jgi:hypothetical protein
MPLTLLLLIAATISPECPAVDPPANPALSLDGKTFVGRMYWPVFPMNLLRYKDTIEFNDGIISSTLAEAGGYQPACYTVIEQDGVVRFTARSERAADDYFHWHGTYNGESLDDVRMVWTKGGKQRTYRFKQRRPRK